jgi:hypothetical protein
MNIPPLSRELQVAKEWRYSSTATQTCEQPRLSCPSITFFKHCQVETAPTPKFLTRQFREYRGCFHTNHPGWHQQRVQILTPSLPDEV